LKKTANQFLWIFAFLLIGLVWLAGLLIDTTGDSGLYSAIVRQMVESGDWFNLKINGTPYLQKPHLFFWLSGLGVQFLGNTNFAFKIFPFLYGLAGIYFTYRLGRQLISEEAGRFAALVAGTSQIFFLYFFDMHTDLVLQTGVVLALWQLAAYFQTQKPLNFVLAFVGIGLAMLSKGPIGAVLPFLTVLIYLLAKRDFQQLFHPKWLVGILIVLVLISPSLLHLYKSFGLSGLKFYFISNNIGRINGELAGSNTDYFFYLHTFLWAFLPWTPVVVISLVKMVKTRLKGFANKEFAAGLSGSVLILLLVLSIAKGKAPNYFLITVPVFSVFAGWWLADFARRVVEVQKGFLKFYLGFAGLNCLFFAFAVRFLGDRSFFLPSIVLAVSGLSLFFIFRLKNDIFIKLILFTVIISAGLNLFLNTKVYPELATFQGGRQVLDLYEKHKKPGDKLYNFDLEDYNLFFYSAEKVENIGSWDEFYKVAATPGSWFYTHEVKMKDFMTLNYKMDTIYQIRQRGMNKVTLKFLNPKTREQALITNFLIVTPANDGINDR
jgi:4-amino-4-deoxy-L-arabinose transferase-like glycosyltransferase